MIEIKQLLNTEGALIAKMFQRNQIYAKVDPSKSVYKDPTSGFIRYSLILRADQRFDAIEKITRELSDALSRQRERMGLPCPINAIPVSVPSFALEVPHPVQQMLLWSPRKITTTQPHTMLIGRSYSGKESKDETVNLADSGSCHALIVGITGAGKSVLLQNMMLSLTASTSPGDLKIVIVDLKNEDMLPFRHLPHVMTFAGTKDQSIDAIRFVYEEKEKRIVNAGYKPYRLVLWIDEMAQLAAMKECAEMLGDLASIGRGKLINLVGATQHPTEKGGLGGLLKANFPVRLVGMVASGQSYVATGRPKIHADLLPGKGAFLRIQGPQVQRFQSFNIEANDVELMANHVADRWGGKRQPIAIDMPVEQAAQRIAPVERKPSAKDVLKPVFDEYNLGNGEMRRGFMSAAVTLLNGGTLPTGTTFQRLKDQVNAYSLTYFGQSDEKIIKFPQKRAVGM